MSEIDERIAELYQQIHTALVNLWLIGQVVGAGEIVVLHNELGLELRDTYGIDGLVDDEESEDYDPYEDEDEESDETEDDELTLANDQDIWQ